MSGVPLFLIRAERKFLTINDEYKMFLCFQLAAERNFLTISPILTSVQCFMWELTSWDCPVIQTGHDRVDWGREGRDGLQILNFPLQLASRNRKIPISSWICPNLGNFKKKANFSAFSVQKPSETLHFPPVCPYNSTMLQHNLEYTPAMVCLAAVLQFFSRVASVLPHIKTTNRLRWATVCKSQIQT